MNLTLLKAICFSIVGLSCGALMKNDSKDIIGLLQKIQDYLHANPDMSKDDIEEIQDRMKKLQQNLESEIKEDATVQALKDMKTQLEEKITKIQKKTGNTATTKGSWMKNNASDIMTNLQQAKSAVEASKGIETSDLRTIFLLLDEIMTLIRKEKNETDNLQALQAQLGAVNSNLKTAIRHDADD